VTSGKLIYTPPVWHTCDPMVTPAPPVGSIWRCGCGQHWLREDARDRTPVTHPSGVRWVRITTNEVKRIIDGTSRPKESAPVALVVDEDLKVREPTSYSLRELLRRRSRLNR
jgi:hypothetical protein